MFYFTTASNAVKRDTDIAGTISIAAKAGVVLAAALPEPIKTWLSLFLISFKYVCCWTTKKV